MFFIPFLDCFCYCWVTDNGNCLCRVGGKIASRHRYAFFVTLLIMLLGNSLINVITFGTPCLVLVFFVSHCQLLWKSLHSGLLLWTRFHFQWFLFSAMLVWQNLRRDYCSVMCVCVCVSGFLLQVMSQSVVVQALQDLEHKATFIVKLNETVISLN